MTSADGRGTLRVLRPDRTPRSSPSSRLGQGPGSSGLLRILHVGSGFRPWRRGGLVAYTEDLLDEQVRRGHEVVYLFSGRHYPFTGGPRLRRWERRGIPMLEILNSPLHDHGRQPELELDEPRLERIVERAVSSVRPDVVHVHELAGLPSSVLRLTREAGIPTVFTLQDYFPLCPDFKLLDAGGAVCLRRDVGEACVATMAALRRSHVLMAETTIRHHLDRWRVLGRLRPDRRERATRRLVEWSTRGVERRGREATLTAGAFQRRRDVNIERLNEVDRLIAMSARVGEIYAMLGVEPTRLRTMQLTLAHIEHLRPRVIAEPPRPVTFATLGGGESEAKGSRILLDAMRAVSDLVAQGRIRLWILGHLSPEVARSAAEVPGVELRGTFTPDRLDEVLDEIDVGLVPSVWEEAYGYVGVEFLAKGIPVIANAIGGMTDYVRDGETGWLNQACTAAGFAQVMREVAERPQEIVELNVALRAQRHEIIVPLARHADEVDALYSETIDAVANRRADAAACG